MERSSAERPAVTPTRQSQRSSRSACRQRGVLPAAPDAPALHVASPGPRPCRTCGNDIWRIGGAHSAQMNRLAAQLLP